MTCYPLKRPARASLLTHGRLGISPRGSKGLTRAFSYAGSRSVLSSLWRVVSQTTEPLMVAFYSYLREGFGKTEALRQAQLDVIGIYPHPRYWAAFCLVGDWR